MRTPDYVYKSIPEPALPVVQAIVTAQRRHSLFPLASTHTDTPATVVVGLSGGADSVCLLHALSLLAPHWGIELHAVHVDHGLRTDSRDDAAFSAGFAHDLGVEFHLISLDGNQLEQDSRGVESAAREARYHALTSVAASLADADQPSTIAVAHHLDDQAETVLMNLVRGSGLRGLGGMAWVRVLEFSTTESGGGSVHSEARLVRPLLEVRRSEIEEYCRAFGLVYREDSTNRNPRHLRNRIRHETLPYLSQLNPQIVSALARTAQLIRPDAQRLDAQDRQLLDAITSDSVRHQSISLNLAGFQQQSLAAKRGVLQHALMALNLDMRDAGNQLVDDLIWRLADDEAPTGPHTLAQGVMWTVMPPMDVAPSMLCLHLQDALPYQPHIPHLSACYADISLPYPLHCPENHPITPTWELHCHRRSITQLPHDWRYNKDSWRAYLDADRVGPLALAIPQQAARFAPLGMAGQHKKVGDLFTDRKIPVPFRTEWPVIIDSATVTIVWVCGLSVSDIVKITPATRHVLQLEWRRTDAVRDAERTEPCEDTTTCV